MRQLLVPRSTATKVGRLLWGAITTDGRRGSGVDRPPVATEGGLTVVKGISGRSGAADVVRKRTDAERRLGGSKGTGTLERQKKQKRR